MADYDVSFFKKPEKKNESEKFLGRVRVDDTGVGPDLTLAAKAFRHAEDRCSAADRLKIQRVRK